MCNNSHLHEIVSILLATVKRKEKYSIKCFHSIESSGRIFTLFQVCSSYFILTKTTSLTMTDVFSTAHLEDYKKTNQFSRVVHF